jgi:hypothetical protein
MFPCIDCKLFLEVTNARSRSAIAQESKLIHQQNKMKVPHAQTRTQMQLRKDIRFIDPVHNLQIIKFLHDKQKYVYFYVKKK